MGPDREAKNGRGSRGGVKSILESVLEIRQSHGLYIPSTNRDLNDSRFLLGVRNSTRRARGSGAAAVSAFATRMRRAQKSCGVNRPYRTIPASSLPANPEPVERLSSRIASRTLSPTAHLGAFCTIARGMKYSAPCSPRRYAFRRTERDWISMVPVVWVIQAGFVVLGRRLLGSLPDRPVERMVIATQDRGSL